VLPRGRCTRSLAGGLSAGSEKHGALTWRKEWERPASGARRHEPKVERAAPFPVRETTLDLCLQRCRHDGREALDRSLDICPACGGHLVEIACSIARQCRPSRSLGQLIIGATAITVRSRSTAPPRVECTPSSPSTINSATALAHAHNAALFLARACPAPARSPLLAALIATQIARQDRSHPHRSACCQVQLP
jgi:hypothetical protein